MNSVLALSAAASASRLSFSVRNCVIEACIPAAMETTEDDAMEFKSNVLGRLEKGEAVENSFGRRRRDYFFSKACNNSQK